jgi:hypothetical protein
LGRARAGEEAASALQVEEVIYGEEQAVVDATVSRGDCTAEREYGNDLDHAFAVLLARAYPRPEANKLIRYTIDSLCEELAAITRMEVPESQRETWIGTALESKSFDSVLTDMGAGDTGEARH